MRWTAVLQAISCVKLGLVERLQALLAAHPAKVHETDDRVHCVLADLHWSCVAVARSLRVSLMLLSWTFGDE